MVSRVAGEGETEKGAKGGGGHDVRSRIGSHYPPGSRFALTNYCYHFHFGDELLDALNTPFSIFNKDFAGYRCVCPGAPRRTAVIEGRRVWRENKGERREGKEEKRGVLLLLRCPAAGQMCWQRAENTGRCLLTPIASLIN